MEISRLPPPLPKTPPALLNQTHPAPQLILAGAGKTTTLTAKIAYMVEKENIAPSQILAITFPEAARNMREKVEKLLQGKEVIVKTFHSFCAELIKDHADRCKDASLYANTIKKTNDLTGFI